MPADDVRIPPLKTCMSDQAVIDAFHRSERERRMTEEQSPFMQADGDPERVAWRDDDGIVHVMKVARFGVWHVEIDFGRHQNLAKMVPNAVAREVAKRILTIVDGRARAVEKANAAAPSEVRTAFLLSGGPLMTALISSGSEYANCTWFFDGQLISAEIAIAALRWETKDESERRLRA